MSAVRSTHPTPRSLAEYTARLRKGARRVTAPRQAILEVLRRQPAPLSPKEIHAALPAGDCDLVTIYRSLHLLEALRMVKRFDLGDGVARYELLDEGDDGHRHHLVCTGCARVVPIHDCFPADLERRIAQLHGFVHVTHRLEFFGLCPSCRPPTQVVRAHRARLRPEVRAGA